MTQHTDYGHRTAVQKLGVRPGDRLQVVGDVGVDLRRELRAAIGRGFVTSGELDGAIVLVASPEEAVAAFSSYRGRMRDTAYLWLITRKRGHPAYMNQMSLVPAARDHGLIDNKTCSVDEGRSGIRFVVPRTLRGSAAGAGTR
jgi:hypothetical protein